MSEHGVVTPLPDRIRARCMGPIGCKVCRAEYLALPEAKRKEVRKRLHFTDAMLQPLEEAKGEDND